MNLWGGWPGKLSGEGLRATLYTRHAPASGLALTVVCADCLPCYDGQKLGAVRPGPVGSRDKVL